jgi:predicted phage-related endonuclease
MPTLKINDEAHWLTVRDQHIGGSDVAALFNRWRLPTGETVVLHAYEAVPEGALPIGSCSPYTTAYRLYLERSGILMPEGWNSSERMDAGTHLEPAIAAWSEAKYKWKLRKVRRYHQHPTVEGWGASVDFEVHGPGMDPVEIKNVDGLIARNNWVIDDEEVIGAPLHIALQLQHYIGAREAGRGWIVACVGGNELVRGMFQRHEATQERIAEAVSAFWAGVRAGIPPIETADYDAVSDELAYGNKTYAPADLTGDVEASALAKRYLRLKAHGEFIEKVKDAAKAKLALKIGLSTKAVGHDFKVTWPVIEREAKLIPAREQAAKTYRGGFTVTAVEPK